MDDSSIASFAHTLGSDLESALTKAIKPPGAFSEGLLDDINSDARTLRKSFKKYGEALANVNKKFPARTPFQFSYDYLRSKSDQVAKEFGVPSNYNDKDYKKLFNIGLSKILPFMRLKSRDTSKINTSTKHALATMSSLYGAISRASHSLSKVYQSVNATGSDKGGSEESSSPDDETDLEKYVGDIERGLGIRGKGNSSSDSKGPEASKTSKSSPVFTPEAYDAYIAKHKNKIRLPSLVVASKEKEILEGLTYASRVAFRRIIQSAQEANNLAISLELAAQVAKKTRQPALYIACSSISRAIQEIYNIVRSSVAMNKKNLEKMNKDLKENGDLSDLFRRNSR